jgi:hypothetical protein
MLGELQCRERESGALEAGWTKEQMWSEQSVCSCQEANPECLVIQLSFGLENKDYHFTTLLIKMGVKDRKCSIIL